MLVWSIPLDDDTCDDVDHTPESGRLCVVVGVFTRGSLKGCPWLYAATMACRLFVPTKSSSVVTLTPPILYSSNRSNRLVHTDSSKREGNHLINAPLNPPLSIKKVCHQLQMVEMYLDSNLFLPEISNFRIPNPFQRIWFSLRLKLTRRSLKKTRRGHGKQH